MGNGQETGYCKEREKADKSTSLRQGSLKTPSSVCHQSRPVEDIHDALNQMCGKRERRIQRQPKNRYSLITMICVPCVDLSLTTSPEKPPGRLATFGVPRQAYVKSSTIGSLTTHCQRPPPSPGSTVKVSSLATSIQNTALSRL